MQAARDNPDQAPRGPFTAVQNAVYGVLYTVGDAQLGIHRAELVIERARELFLNGFAQFKDGPFDEIEAVLYSAAALLRELHAELDAADGKHREAVK